MSSPLDMKGEALRLLRRLTENPASVFRPGQLEAILALVVHRGWCCWCSAPGGVRVSFPLYLELLCQSTTGSTLIKTGLTNGYP